LSRRAYKNGGYENTHLLLILRLNNGGL